MPLYDYVCQNCGHFTHEKKMNDENLQKCPTCGEPVMRLYNTGGISWKCGGSFSRVGSK